MILLIDNYDSFVHNLARYLGELGRGREVRRNDAVTVAALAARNPEAILLSPGPGRPDDAGVCLEVVRELGARVPILGVCLGHQVVAQAYGADVRRALRPMHGRASQIRHDGEGLFLGLPSPLEAARYHSLVVEPPPPTSPLVVTARSAEGEVMALRHRELPVFGVQFHPESVLTQGGHALLANFLRFADAWHAAREAS